MFFLTSGLILMSYITVMFCKTTNFKPLFLTGENLMIKCDPGAQKQSEVAGVYL